LKLFHFFILFISILVLNGCGSVSKGIVEGFLAKEEEEDTRLCQIRGEPFSGLASIVKDPEVTAKVLMIHGVGDHIPGYSTELMEKLANQLKLNYIAKITKNIALTDPQDNSKKLGNLRVNRLSNQDKSHELLFYELTWSEITAGEKKILSYDNSGEHSFRRAMVNKILKKFANDTGPDPMIYLGKSQGDILTSFAQSFCWMISSQWDDAPIDVTQGCIPSQQAIENIKTDHYAFISHSLGSRITIDGLQQIATLFGAEKSTLKDPSNLAEKLQHTLKEKHIPIFMLSNQLPMLQLGRELPEITGQKEDYCRAEGKHYKSRLFSKTSIIAFSDPNDLLSYTLPMGFIDHYLDSRLCVNATNISINIATVIDAFGIDMADPLEAHVGYETDDRVIALLVNGVGNKNTSAIIKKRCQTLMTID